MGNVPAIDVLPEQESPSSLSLKSVVTGPLEEYCDYESFLDELLPILKEPLYPLERYVLKSLEIKDLGPEAFSVKVVHDGDKLRMYGLGDFVKDGQDLLRAWQTVRYSREGREIVVEHFKEDGGVHETYFSRFLSGPLRIEFWCITSTGERKCDEGMAQILKQFYVVPVLKQLMKRKVAVNPCIESPSGGGKSAISDPLDDYVDFDGCFDAVIEVLQDTVAANGGQVHELSEREFEMVVEAPNLAAGGASAKMTQLVRHERSKGEVVNVASVGGQLMYTSWIVVHPTPLVVEHWTEVDGKRVCGRQEAGVLQSFVDGIVAKTNGSSGWFF